MTVLELPVIEPYHVGKSGRRARRHFVNGRVDVGQNGQGAHFLGLILVTMESGLNNTGGGGFGSGLWVHFWLTFLDPGPRFWGSPPPNGGAKQKNLGSNYVPDGAPHPD